MIKQTQLKLLQWILNVSTYVPCMQENTPTTGNDLWNNNLRMSSFSVSLFLNVVIYVTEEENNEGRPISDALGFDK